MTEELLINKINKLPLNFKNEIEDFVDFLLLKNNISVAKNKKQIIFGYAKGSITIKPNFDEPLKEFNEYLQ
jgi:hypothetical protein